MKSFNKLIHKFTVATLALLATSILPACEDEYYPVSDYYSFPESITLEGDEVLDLSDIATPKFSSNTLVIPASVAVSYMKSSDSSILYSFGGKVKALRKGTARIEIYNVENDWIQSIPVNVISDNRVPLKLVEFPGNHIDLNRYESVSLVEFLEGGSTMDVPHYYKFESKDPGIVSVSIFGMVSAMKYGTTAIDILNTNGELINTITVTCVSPVELEEFSQNPIELKIYSSLSLVKKSDSYSMDAIPATYTFSSSDQSVAKVNQYGDVSAVGIGETTISIKETYSGKELKSFSLIVTPTLDLKMTVGETIDISTMLSSSEYVIRNMVSENPDVVQVSLVNSILTAVGKGTTVITSPLGYSGQKSVYIIVTVE